MKYKIKYLIVGGGIGGLNAGLSLIEKGIKGSEIMIIEKSYRFGGKINTIYLKDMDINFECGAGRFTNNHKLLIKYIKRYNLSDQIRELSNEKEYYIRNSKDPEKVFKVETEIKLDPYNLIKKVIDESRNRDYSEDYLSSITFKELCIDIIGNESTIFLIDSFGYNSEFEILNGNDAIRIFKNDFNIKNKYYVLGGGLSQIIQSMTDELIKKNVRLILKTKLLDFRYVEKRFKSKFTDDIEIESKYMILALDKIALLKLDILKDIEDLIKSVDTVKLNRIYGIFPKGKNGKVWFDGIPKTTTDLPIRQFIPINAKKGLAMVSYSDSEYAEDWQDKVINGTSKRYIMRYLHKMFPNSIIPAPTLIDYHYWYNGTHCWLTHVNSSKIKRRLIKPYERIDLYICGEVFSDNQGWIEGALETSDKVVKMIKNKEDIKYKYYSESEIEKHNKETDGWTIINNRVYDITEWINIHLGGKIIINALGKDGTNMFKYYNHPDYAKRILENYFIGYVKNKKSI